jgi:hypothetical protein
MATHDVSFTVPYLSLGKANVEFKININGAQPRTLLGSKGALVGYPSKGKHGFRLGWAKFDQLAREGSKGYYTTPNLLIS